MANYKKDWSARKTFYVCKMDNGKDYFVKINERNLVTTTPYEDLISSLEQMLADAKEKAAKHNTEVQSHAPNAIS